MPVNVTIAAQRISMKFDILLHWDRFDCRISKETYASCSCVHCSWQSTSAFSSERSLGPIAFSDTVWIFHNFLVSNRRK